MAFHHGRFFPNVMCHSGDVSKQDDGCAARIGPSFPFLVKRRPDGPEIQLSLYPKDRTLSDRPAMSVSCHQPTCWAIVFLIIVRRPPRSGHTRGSHWL